MQTGKMMLKLCSWALGIGALVLIYTVAVTQNQKKNAPQKNTPLAIKDSAQQDEDSVEIIGTPTGDDPWKEVTKLVDAYYSKTGMEYKGSIKVIDDNGDKEKVIEEQPFEYTILNNDYYYRLAHMEVVNKKNFLLAVDNDNKTISMAKNAVMHKTNKAFDIRAFKKVMEKGKAHALVTRDGDEKILTIDNIGDPDIQGYRIYYSPQTYRVHKMLIGMVRLSPLEDENEEQDEEKANHATAAPEQNAGDEETITNYYYYLEVLFEKVQPLALKEKDFNPENKFLQVQNGSVVLAPAFKEYQLLNTIEP
jgi:hypothetical protein